MTTKFNARALAQRSLIAGAAIAALTAGTAQAQSSVTLYGRVDAGILYRDKSPTTDNSVTEQSNGGIRPSIWGLKGSEDLGNGMSAVFNLEAHFFADTGLASTGQQFRRQSNVGLKSDYGTVLFGRQYSPALLATIGVEPRAYKEEFSGLYQWAYNQASSVLGDQGVNNGNGTNAAVGVFVSNAVSYTNSFGPVAVGVSYSFGEQAGSFKDGRVMSAGLTYTGPDLLGGGPLVLAGGYQEMTDQTTGVRVGDTSALGFALPFGPVTLKVMGLNQLTKDSFGGRTGKVETYTGGIDWKWSDANSATVAYYDSKNKFRPLGAAEDKQQSIVLSNDYSLSKRTTVYAQYTYVKAEDGATLRTTIVSNGVLPGEKTNLFNVGISHNF